MNVSEIDYILIKNIAGELPEKLPNGKDIDILVNESQQKDYELMMRKNGFYRCLPPLGKMNGWRFLYDLPEYEFWKLKDKNSDMYIDTSFKLCCKGIMPNTWIPLDDMIQKRIWKSKIWDDEKEWWIMDTETSLLYYLVRCIFDKGRFSESYIVEIEKAYGQADMEIVRRLMNPVFFKFTERLLELLEKKCYSDIIKDYITFGEY